jgi:hypothetical protein
MEQEETDIASVRHWCKASHVEDPDALSAFNEGRGIFDVSPNGVKVDAFVSRHSLQNQFLRNSFTGLIGHRHIYFVFESQPN